MVEEKKDVNTEESSASEDVTAESSSANSNSVSEVDEKVDSSSAEGQEEEQGKIPYSRFKEVNDGYKSEKQKREELETRLAEIEAMNKDVPEQKESVQEEKDEFVEKTIKEYVEEGVKPAFAKKLALSMWKMGQIQGERQSQKTMAPLIEKYNNEQIKAEVTAWKSKQKDLTPETEEAMAKYFSSLPEDKKKAVWGLGEERFDYLKSKVMAAKPAIPQNKKLGQSIGSPKGKGSSEDYKSWTEEQVTDWLKTNPSEEDYEKYAKAVGLRSEY